MNYDFRADLLTVHKKDIRDHSRQAASEEFMLSERPLLGVRFVADVVVQTAVADFMDYLQVSMGLAPALTDGAAELTVLLEEKEEDERTFCICTDAKGIQVTAHHPRGIAQALYYMEDLMSFERAPLLKYGKVEKTLLYSPRMVHSGYGLDEYPDEYLSAIAHAGRDAILVFTKGVNQTPQGYLDFNDLIDRAAKYGIDVYAYSYLKSTKSPYEDDAEEFYENTYGALFKACPKLRGVTLVGESVEFPSKDPHVAKGRHAETKVDGIPIGKPSSGWYPCYDYPVWLNLVKKIVRKYNPSADIVFWSYNWCYQPKEARLALIKNLPSDITLQATFEMAAHIPYEHSVGWTADYTLSSVGPSAYFESEAAVAKERGIRLYSMTNTAGRTWDFGVAPYEPMPYQWIERYRQMERAHDKYGLCGVMEGHHYGFYPSFISTLSKHFFMRPQEDGVLEKILSSEYGAENYPAVEKAVSFFSEAIQHYVPSGADQYGAFRVGPSYPFNLYAVVNLPTDPKAHFGNAIIEPTYRNRSTMKLSPLSLRLADEIASLERMLDLMEQGVAALEQATEQAGELLNLGRFLTRCVRTGLHSKQWYRLISRMHTCESKEGLSAIYDEMEALLNQELENVEQTIPLVEKDSRLGFEASMLYVTDRWHLEWKMRQLRYVLDTELKESRMGLDL